MSRPNLEVKYDRTEGQLMNPTFILCDPETNGRAFPYTIDDVLDLLQDFEDGYGVRNPLEIKVINKTATLVVGYRRLLASLIWYAGNEARGILPHPDFQVPTVVVKPKDAIDELIMNIRENVAKKSLNSIDLGSNAVRLKAFGKSVGEVARILGVSDAQVSQHVKLVTELPENYQHLVSIGQLTADDAFTILKIPAEARDGVLREYLESKATALLDDSNALDEASPSPAVSEATERVSEPSSPAPKAKNLRALAGAAGAELGSKRMPEFKKYLKEAIEMEGPGSNAGEVALKKELLKFLEGKLTAIQMDNRFDKFCKPGKEKNV